METSEATTVSQARRDGERAVCEALAARYSVTMQFEPKGEVVNHTRDYRARLRVVDPVTRLQREGAVVGLFGVDEEPPDVAAVLIEVRLLCLHWDRSPDVFAWLIEHPYGDFVSLEYARESYRQSREMRAEMVRLLGESGYQEWTQAGQE